MEGPTTPAGSPEPVRAATEAELEVKLEQDDEVQEVEEEIRALRPHHDAADPNHDNDEPAGPALSSEYAPCEDFRWAQIDPTEETNAAVQQTTEEEEGFTTLDFSALASGVRRNANWSTSVTAVLLEALSVLPHIGQGKKLHYLIGGKKLNRSDAIVQYIRNKTGEVMTKTQVNNRLTSVREAGAVNPIYQLLFAQKRGLDRVAAGDDWTSKLGPNLFPNIAIPSSSPAKAKTKGKRRVAISLDDNSYEGRPSSSRPRPPASVPSAGNSAVEASPPPAHKRYKADVQPLLASSQQQYLQPSTARADSPSFVLPNSTYAPYRHAATKLSLVPFPSTTVSSSSSHMSRSLNPPLTFTEPAPEAISASDLASLLSSLFPSHDFTLSASALHSSGLTSLDYLAELVHFEDNSVETFLERVIKKGKLGTLQGGWMRKAVMRLREEVGAEGLPGT